MKKETTEIKVAYQAPELEVYTVDVLQSVMSNWGAEGEPGAIMDESEGNLWIF